MPQLNAHLQALLFVPFFPPPGVHHGARSQSGLRPTAKGPNTGPGHTGHAGPPKLSDSTDVSTHTPVDLSLAWQGLILCGEPQPFASHYDPFPEGASQSQQSYSVKNKDASKNT